MTFLGTRCLLNGFEKKITLGEEFKLNMTFLNVYYGLYIL